MFDILFETPPSRNLYVIPDSEIKELQRSQNQDELEEIRHQKNLKKHPKLKSIILMNKKKVKN